MDKAGRPTLHDVAREAGVSWATASRVINGSSTYKVSEGTRQRVLQVVAALGYHSSIPARALRSKRTLQYGLVIRNLAVSFMPDVLEGLQEVATQLEYGCLLHMSYDRPNLEKHWFETLVSRRVDGVLWIPAYEQEPSMETLVRQLPVVQLLYSSSLPGVPAVLIDQQSGGYQATHYLVQLGHRRIAYIVRAGVHWQQRLVGYRQALVDNCITPDPATEITTTENWDQLAKAFKQLMASEKPPTAIIAPSDMSAWGLCRIAHELGYSVPHDVSIMGFGNTNITEKTEVPLTTVDHPKREIGVQAMLMLKELMEGKAVQDSLFKPSVVSRGSTCPPPALR